ncbi:MAG: hypothetical protein IJK18_09345 [Clostridia bacterium]|nr:hypothetical protein [Clostridia bacterium]
MEKKNNFEISDDNKLGKENNKVKLQKPPKLSSEEYHKEEIQQNKMIVKNAICMIWVGILLIIASFIVYTLKFTETLVAGTICGCFIDLLSATILYIFNKSNENKQNYFSDLSYHENEEKIIKLVENTEDDQLKKELIKKLMNNHFKK